MSGVAIPYVELLQIEFLASGQPGWSAPFRLKNFQIELSERPGQSVGLGLPMGFTWIVAETEKQCAVGRDM